MPSLAGEIDCAAGSRHFHHMAIARRLLHGPNMPDICGKKEGFNPTQSENGIIAALSAGRVLGALESLQLHKSFHSGQMSFRNGSSEFGDFKRFVCDCF
jgi:hypothetical protein